MMLLIHREKKIIKFLGFSSLLFIAVFLAWNSWLTGWHELSYSERESMQEYRKEIGSDYIYCMRVKASKKSYEAIVKKRNLSKKIVVDAHFPTQCLDLPGWSIPPNAMPEYSGANAKDTLDLAARIDEIVYFSSQSW